MRTRFAAAKAVIVRNRVRIFDAGLIISCLVVAALIAFEFDVFLTAPSLSKEQQTLELDEVLMLTVLAMAGLLAYATRRASEHQRENARRIEAEREALKLAFHDPLTGLPNRRLLDDALKAALLTPPPEPQAHALCLIDLNGFKKINDVHGHPTGDQALIRVAARLRGAIRDDDLVVRLGGDEFAVLARNLSGPEAAANVAVRILECLAETIEISGAVHRIGAGVGVALTPQDAGDPAELMRKADVALYRAKARREPAIRFFEPEMDTRLKERDELERDLHATMGRDAFDLVFRMSARMDGAIAGFEATPRWRHPRFGDLGPERFCPIAEEAGVLAPLYDRLLRKALRAAAGWPDNLRLSFEAPGEMLCEPSFAPRALAALTELGFPPARLDLEIDEGALIRNPDGAEALIAPLRAVGVSIVAARFGTGYADLAALHRLRLARVRIDHSFVSAMTRDRRAAVMVKALIGIGQGLDLDVIAEGVFSPAQTRQLARQGCNEARGVLFGEQLSEIQAAHLAATAGAAGAITLVG